MKLKFARDGYGGKFVRGYEVEADRIKYDRKYSPFAIAVRVVSEWKRPQWVSLGWFVEGAWEK